MALARIVRMKVLSIDIDYIVDNYLNERYDGELRPWFNKTADVWLYWWMALHKTGEGESQYHNKGNFEFIEQVFLEALKAQPRVIFSTDHDDIFHFVEDAEDIEIINIDAHHDLVQDINFHEGSWGWYLWPKVRSWTWVKNKWPDGGGSKLTKEPIDPKLKIITKNDWDTIDFRPDLVFVTLSIDYLDPKFWWAYAKLKKHHRRHITSTRVPPNKDGVYPRVWPKELDEEASKN